MKKQFLAYLHTHWDLEWYRDVEDFNMRFLEVFDIVLDELKNNRAPFFYLDGQVIALLNYLKYRKEKIDEIKSLIQEKKLAIGPYYVISDSYLVNFRSMLKNLEIGLNISKDFNQKEFIGYLSDIFGISKSAFLALQLNSIDKALIWRGVNPVSINNNCNFTHKNIKTTWLAQGYFNDFFHSDSPNIEAIKKYLDKIAKYSPNNALLPIGADHLGMLKNANEKIKQINKELDNYEIILCNPFEYFKQTEFNNSAACEEFLDNSDTYILQGVYSARIPQKIRNNKIQNQVSRIIEPLNFYLKDNYSSHVDEIYKTLIKNHAHDGIYGCSIDSVHRTVESRIDKCENMTNAILKRLIGNFKKNNNITGKSKDKIGLFNLSNYDNIKTLEVKLPYILDNAQVISKEEKFPDELLYDIYKIPITEDITPIYTQLVEISDNKKFEFNTVSITEPQKKVKITDSLIQNEFIKLEVKNNKILINNEFYLKLTDIKDSGDTYNFAPKGDYKTLELLKTKVVYDGLIESKLRLYFKDIELDISLNNHSKFLKFDSRIKNKKKNHKIELSLALKEKIYETIAQDVIGTIKREHNPNYNIKKFMPAVRPYELKTNSYPMQNFVCTQGVAIITQGLHEYSIYKNELKICLLRCTDTISNPKNATRAIPAGPNLKTPDAQCLVEFSAQGAILFASEKEVFLHLDEFLKNYVAIDGNYNKELNIKLDKIESNSYIYGISNNKKISYNLESKEVSLI